MIKGNIVDKTHKSIILYLINNPNSTYTQVASAVGCSYPWAKEKISELVDIGVVEVNDKAYPTTYSINKDLVKIKYSTHQFFTQLILLLLSIVSSIFVSSFVFGDIKFLLGSIFSAMFLYIYFLKKVLFEPEHKIVEIEVNNAKKV